MSTIIGEVSLPPIRVTIPDGTHIFSDKNDIDHILSNVLGRDVRLMRVSLEKPIYEEYWPDIDGLAQRDKVIEEAIPPQTFFDIAVIHLLTTSTITVCGNYIQKADLKFDVLGQTLW